MKEHAFREGLRDAIPTALGYASIGLACGAGLYRSIQEFQLSKWA